MNLARMGATTERRRFARASGLDEVPHGSSHYRTQLKIATPSVQAELNEFNGDQRKPYWLRVRDELQEPFHVGVGKILDELLSDKRDQKAFREPVALALDITTFPFHVAPFIPSADDPDPDRGDYLAEWTSQNGTQYEKWVRGDFPEMVAGVKEKDGRAYKFATITVIIENTPIVLGWEPVRDVRAWEEGEPFSRSRAEIVDSLLEQADRHLDFHKVFCDREFDVHEIRHTIFKQNATYVIGKRVSSKADKKGLDEVESKPGYGFGLEHSTLTVDSESHDVTIVYAPRWGSDEQYSIFTVTGHVDFGRAQALLSQYNHRMEIENQYKTIKQHFIPQTASKDYRLRLWYFVVGVILYNVWRMANFELREMVDGDLGERPPILAGEIVEILGFYLIEPGGNSVH